MGTLIGGVLALVGWAIAPGLVFYFDVTPKIAVMLLGSAVILPWLLVRGHAGGRFTVLMSVFWISLAISTALSPHLELSIGGSNWRRLGMITWTAIVILTCACAQLRPAGVRQVVRVIALTGCFAAVYGISQFFGFDPWLKPESYRVGEGEWTIVRPPGPLGYVTYFATYLVGVVFAGVALFAEERRGWRIAGASCAAVATVAIVLSGTRGALVGLLAGALVLFVVLRPRLGLRTGIAALAIAILGGLFYYSPPGQQLRSRTRWYLEDPTGGARLWLWRDTWAVVRQNWPAGIGPESFSREFPRFQSAELSRSFPDFYHESPHNIFLDVLAAQGAPGLILLFGGMWVAVSAGRRARLRHPVLAGALLAWLAASTVAQQFSSFTAPTALFFFVCLGLLAALRENRLGAAPRRTVAGALAAPVSLVLVVFAVRLVIADRMVGLTQSAIAGNRTNEAIENYRLASRWAPAGFSGDLWYARSLASSAQKAASTRERHQAWQEALVAAACAINSADDPQNAWYNLAVFFGIQNDAARAEEALRRAIAISPNWYKPHWMLAQVLRLAGRFEEAREEAVLAADLNGGKAPEVLRTAEQTRAEASSVR